MKYLITTREKFKTVCHSSYKDFFISIYSKSLKENADILTSQKMVRIAFDQPKAEFVHAVLRESVILAGI